MHVLIADLHDIPRPADYIATFKPVRLEAYQLLNRLLNMGGYLRDQLELKGADIHQITDALAVLVDVSGAILKDFEKQPSKGRSKNNALLATILQLRRIFWDSYHGPRSGRRQRGAFEFISDEETRELEFVKTALQDAGIAYHDLRRLFRDLRSIPLKEKASTLSRGANKGRRARERGEKKNTT